jgi:cell division transport system ATP-binding protein
MEQKTLIRYKDVEICQESQIVLKNVNLEIYKGELIYLVGKVGSGKSSLLKSFYGELPIEKGETEILNYDVKNIKNKDIPYLRRKLGIVFQDFQLLTDRSVHANLEFVLHATNWKNKSDIEKRIEDVLKQVGMTNKGYKMPHELSGGEQQRIVIARALLNSPEIILADEPTGNLDPQTGTQIMELLYGIKENGTTVVMATHNMNWVENFQGRVLKCEDGELISL